MDKFNFFESYKGDVPSFVHDIPYAVLEKIKKSFGNEVYESAKKAYDIGAKKRYFGELDVMDLKRGRMICKFDFKNGICKQINYVEWHEDNIVWMRSVLNDKVSFSKDKKRWDAKATASQNQDQDNAINKTTLNGGK